MFDVIGAIEACYRPASESFWASALLDALAPIDGGHGMFVAAYDMRDPARFQFRFLATRGNLPPSAQDAAARLFEAPNPQLVRGMFSPSPPVDLGSRRLRRWLARSPARLFHVRGGNVERSALLRYFQESAGIRDTLGILAGEHDGRGVFVGVPMSGERAPSPRTVHQLAHVSAHIVSARRLQRLCDEPLGPAAVDAVLEPSGSVKHVVGSARAPEARRLLSEAVRRMERARGRARWVDPEEAMSLWQGLVRGEWTLVDHCDGDGLRFVLARRNRPDVDDPRALTPHERSVLGYAALGHSNKFIGYMLGMAPSTIAGHLRDVQRKLGLASRRELIEAFARFTEVARAAPHDHSRPSRSWRRDLDRSAG